MTTTTNPAGTSLFSAIRTTGQNQQDDSENPKQDGNNEPARCANCGGVIAQDDLECPHCGISLVSG